MTTTTTAPTREYRYIGKCKGCGNVVSVLSGTKPDRYGFMSGFGRTRNCRAEGCGRLFSFKVVSGTYTADRACDPRCTSSKSHKCSCACGGLNHGLDHAS